MVRNMLAKKGNDYRTNPLSMAEKIDRIFDDMFTGFPAFPKTGMLEAAFIPKIDIAEHEKDYSISVELPGIDKKDIKLSINENNLVIEGEKKDEKEEKTSNYYHVERSFGSFRRVIPLGAGVDEEKIDADFANGLLKITIPKNEVATKKKLIDIK